MNFQSQVDISAFETDQDPTLLMVSEAIDKESPEIPVFSNNKFTVRTIRKFKLRIALLWYFKQMKNPSIHFFPSMQLTTFPSSPILSLL